MYAESHNLTMSSGGYRFWKKGGSSKNSPREARRIFWSRPFGAWPECAPAHIDIVLGVLEEIKWSCTAVHCLPDFFFLNK